MSKDSVYNDLLDHIRTDRRDLFNLDRLKKGMNEKHLDAIVAASLVNVTYTGGFYMWFPTLLTFVVTTTDGDQTLIINEAEAYFAREYSWIEDVRTYRYAASTIRANQQAVTLLAQSLIERNMTDSRVGIEKQFLPMLYGDELISRVPKIGLVEADDVFEFARLVKTPTEIQVFRLAAYYTDKAIHTAFALTKPGDTEKAVASLMQANALKLGADGLGHAVVHAGVHSTVVSAWPMEKAFDPGELIHVDFGAVFGGYSTDIARNAVVGQASARQDLMYRRLWEIEQLVIERMEPGAISGELFDVAEQAFKDAGLVHPWGTIGHSTGLSIHEGFEIARESDRVLETGMLINVEPSHIESGEARYHIEDTLLVTENGAELLSNFASRERLFVIQ